MAIMEYRFLSLAARTFAATCLTFITFAHDAFASVTGEQRVLVIPVEFEDVTPENSIDDLRRWMESGVGGYFREVSLGQLQIDVEMVRAWVPLNNPRGTYDIGEEPDHVALAIDALYAADAFCESSPDVCPGGTPVDWGRYSQDRGLAADNHPVIVVIHSGEKVGEARALHLGADWWRPAGYDYPVPDALENELAEWRIGVAVLSETTEIIITADEEGRVTDHEWQSHKGAYAHEMLHAFGGGPPRPDSTVSDDVEGSKQGIADLYDAFADFSALGISGLVDTQDDFTAYWAVMGAGSHNPFAPLWGLEGNVCSYLATADFGQYPSYPSSYTQIRLGWLDEGDEAQVYRAEPPAPNTGTRTHTVVIRPLEIDPDGEPCPVSDVPCTRVVKVPIDDNDQVYYLVEVRKFLGSDAGLPGEGVVILAVDESRYSGTGIVRVRDDTPEEAIALCNMLANPLADAIWEPQQTFEAPSALGVSITVDTQEDDGSYRVTVTYPEVALPDVAITPWEAPPYQTVDIWIDSGCANAFGALDAGADAVGNRDPLCLDEPNDLYARVRNDGNADAHGVVVRFFWAPYIAGSGFGEWSFIGEERGDVPAGGDPAEFSVTWDSPLSADLEAEGVRHFCLKVDVYSENDANSGNQKAQENIFDVFPHSTIVDAFLVQNPSNEPKLVYFQIDPTPLPEGWRVELHPGDALPSLPHVPFTGGPARPLLRLGPGQKTRVGIRITPPDKFEPQLINVTPLAFLGDVLTSLGGVSYAVRIGIPTSLSVTVGDGKLTTVGPLLVRGHLKPPVGRATLNLAYTRPDGTRSDRRVYTDTTGAFIDEVVGPVPPGTWHVAAHWRGDLTHTSAESQELTFNVRPIAGQFNWRWLIGMLVAAAVVAGVIYLRRRSTKLSH